MNREYHRWYSPRLGREMQLLVFGHAGMPVLVFPTSQGRFYEFEDRGMIAATSWRYDSGAIQAYCVDSVDSESWYNRHVHPRHRVERHLAYEAYLLDEVLPLIRVKNSSRALGATGCSFGAYHAVNFGLRHPDLVSHVVSMSGAFDMQPFLDGYYDNDCYFQCPVHFLPNMNDPWYLDRYRGMRIVLGAGEHDICLGETRRLSGMLHAKSVPHCLDVWGEGAVHDWPLWQRMAQKYFA
ncbi:MAG TPA: alpha/beta hydrolase-fold protein [Candidatus Acidoferrales bacterium]|nr:alpha/beta hydrolase-fold protein [Candidatus Acidoferrales bacterium]